VTEALSSQICTTQMLDTLCSGHVGGIEYGVPGISAIAEVMKTCVIPGTPYLIEERAGEECHCLLMAGLERIVAPHTYYRILKRRLSEWLFPNQFTNSTVVNFQALSRLFC
jgi:hypothetical protein